eukprot:g42936.t1
MLPQELASRAAVDIQFVATIIQHLKTAVLRPNVVHQLKDTQVCGGIPSARVSRSEDLLVGLLLGLAKLAINSSRQRAVEEAECLPLFHGYNRAWVSLEMEHAVCTGPLMPFRRVVKIEQPAILLLATCRPVILAGDTASLMQTDNAAGGGGRGMGAADNKPDTTSKSLMEMVKIAKLHDIFSTLQMERSKTEELKMDYTGVRTMNLQFESLVVCWEIVKWNIKRFIILKGVQKEKAFDRISHMYTWDMVSKMDFEEGIFNWIRMLYTNISSAVSIN